MSGAASGSHARLLALVQALLTVPSVFVFLYANEELEGVLPRYERLTVRVVPKRSSWGRLVLTGFDVCRFTRNDGLDLIQFETVPLPRLTRPKTLISIHDLREFHSAKESGSNLRLRDRLRKKMLRSAARRAAAVVTLTYWSANDIQTRLGLSPDKVLIVPFSFDPSDLDGSPISLKQEVLGRFVVSIGHLERRKNHEVLIDAARSRYWPHDVRLIIAGEDHGERDRLEVYATTSNGNVEIWGPVSERKKQELLSQAELVLLPSLLEGFGIVACEAVQAGTPVLVSDRAALPEVVGVPDAVIPALNAHNWASKVAMFVSSPSSRDALWKSEQSSMLRFDHSAVGRQFAETLAVVVSQGLNRDGTMS